MLVGPTAASSTARRSTPLGTGTKRAFVCASASRKAAPPNMALPKLIAFDLDATLWLEEMYLISGPPFRLTTGKGGRPIIIDRGGNEVALLGDAWSILNELATDPKWEATQVAYVSRTDEVDWAHHCLNLFKLDCGMSLHELADHHEIYPGSKRTHFTRIHERTRIPYSEMLFFDDMSWNLEDCAALGVVGMRTPRGLTADVWNKGLRKFAERRISYVR